MIKRVFDIIVSFAGLVVLLPFIVLISLLIAVFSPGPVFYLQSRVGRNGLDFKLIKFRTMRTGAERQGLLTVGGRDPRVTKLGFYLRKHKIDELPQLLNVLLGDMSVVGPRPEVRKYVDLYTDSQKEILSVKPGITDYASLEYFDENELLGHSSEPERVYINDVMPAKIELNKKYISEAGLKTDLKIIFRTIGKIFWRA